MNKTSPPPSLATGGFTLIEVLAALAVVAIALASTINLTGQFAAHAGYLRDKSYAMWVAQDRILEWQALSPPGSTGLHQGQSLMGGKSWSWSVQVSRTPIPGLKRMEVFVKGQESDSAPLVHLSALLKQKV